FGLCSKKVTIPDTQQGHNDGNILVEWLLPEMPVAGMGTLQQFFKTIIPNAERYGKTNGAPERIASTHPIPELKHIFLINTKLHHFLLIGAKGHKMPGDMGFVLCLFQEPLPRCMRIGHGFLRGECFGSDEKER